MSLAALLLPFLAAGSVQTNPRLYVHQHTPYADMARVRRELDLVVELGFGGVRTEWGAKELLNKDNSFGGTWSQVKVIDPFLRELKKRNLGLHVTFGASRPGASVEQEMVLYRYVMNETARQLGPGKVSWTVANEPQAWMDRTVDRSVAARGQSLVRFWEQSKFKDRGFWLYSPTFHGWQHWSERRVDMSEEISKGTDYLKFVYDQPQNRFLSQLGCAFHIYAPSSGYEAGVYAQAKARAVLATLSRRSFTNPIIVTEANIRPNGEVPMYDRGLKTASVAKALLKQPELGIVVVYCLAGHKNMDFISAEGKREEDRIRGWKEGMRRSETRLTRRLLPVR